MPGFYKVLTVLLLLHMTSVMTGQDLPILKDDDAISHGRLANGIEYYLIQSTVTGSHTDMALVQKGRKPDSAVREALSDLQHFHDSKPYDFLARNGISYADYGYCYSNKSATIYRFRQVPMFDTYASDSTLMLLFDIARTYPESQAIIISGDMDKSKILERMKVLSMVVSPRSEIDKEYEFKYLPGQGRVRSLTHNFSSNLCRLSVTFSSGRTPKEYLKTAVPFLTGMYSEQLGYIVTERLRKSLKLAGIGAADISFDYSDSSESPEAETHTIGMTVRVSDLSSATSVLAGVLSSMDTHGAEIHEFREAKKSMIELDVMNVGDFHISNAGYVDKCIAAYLYGSSLAKGSAVSTLFGNKVVDNRVELDLFNSFVSALLGRGDFQIDCSLPRGYGETPDLLETFKQAWNSVAGTDEVVSMTELDTAALDADLRKVKLKSEVTEPLTGGKLWTFSNGIRVIYKNIPSGGRFRYGLVIKGGSDSVPGILKGENAFLGDILLEGRIDGLDRESFQRILAYNGITLNADVTLSDLRLTGSAPASSLDKVMEMLYGIGYRRSRDKIDHQSFIAREKLFAEAEAMSTGGIRNIIDDRLHMDEFHSSRRRVENLNPDTYSKAVNYFDDQFSKCNDGIFVFVGDIPEAVLKETLCRDLGSFSVSGRHSYRGHAGIPDIKLWSTVTVAGEYSVNVGLTVKKGYSMNQHMAFNIATLMLKKDIERRCAALGVTVSVTNVSGSIYIGCRSCDESGLPSEVRTATRAMVLSQIRSSLSHMAQNQLSPSDLSFCKSELQAEIASAASDPDAMLDYTVKRYIEGRDFYTGYKDAIKAVSAKDVQNILKQFSSAPRVELMVK